MIQKLVVCNFKSYKDTTTVDFGSSMFSAIIGPNGVGKSNLMDAISFGFGSSLADLRTRALSDLIWRDPEDGTSAGHGHVEIWFDDCVLRRELEGRYLIDGSVVDADAYLERLDSFGISKHNNSLVFQGSIERMAALTPIQLGNLFEEVSGSDQFRNEYDQLAAELSTKRQAAAVAGREKSRQFAIVKRLNATRETAKERTRIDARISKLGERELALRAALLDSRVAESEREIKQLKREKRLAAANASSSSAEVTAIKRQLVTALRNIQAKEEEARVAQNATNRATAGLLTAHSQRESSSNSLDDLEPQIVTATKELALFDTDLGSLQEKLASSERGYERLLADIPQYEGDMDLYAQCTADFNRETALDQAELGRARRQAATLESDLTVVADQMQQLESRASQITHQHRLADLKYSESRAKLERYSMRLETLGRERDAAVAELEEIKSEVITKENLLRKKAKDLEGMKSDKRRADQRNSLLERAQKIKRNNDGVRGPLYTLVQPKEDRFSAALDLILAGNFNAIVVETAAVARKCIEFCQETKVGVTTFLPIKGLTSKPIDSRLRSIDGARLAIDAITYERDFAPVLAYVCSDTLLCDSAEVAYRLRREGYRSKLVAVDGTVLHSNSIVTAGGVEENRFEKHRASTLRAQVVELVDELKANKLNQTSVTQQVYDANQRIKEVEAKRQFLEDQAQAEEHTRAAFEHDVKTCERQRRDLEARKAAIQESLEECLEEINTVKRGFASLKRRIYEPFSATTTVDVDTFQEALEKRQKLGVELEKQRARLDTEIQYARAKQEGCSARLDRLRQQHTTLATSLETATAKIADCRKVLDNSKDVKGTTQAEINTLEARVEALNAQLGEIQGQEVDSGDKTDDIQEKVNELEAARNTAENQRELMEECDEELAAELLESFESTTAIQAEIEKIQEDVRALATEREKLIVDQDTDDLDEAEEQLTQLTEELEDAQKAVNLIERQLTKVKNKRTKELLKVLEPVQEAVKVIYKELTTTNIDPLGGTAALRPINEAEPFLEGIKYSAMPPRKPFTDILQLSGGEKTIAALALIFALNTYRTSPIYVFDEVDAALDYANVHLVAKYIASCAEKGSQFVVISLKLWFFEHANSLLGVYRKKDIPGSKLVSYALSA